MNWEHLKKNLEDLYNSKGLTDCFEKEENYLRNSFYEMEELWNSQFDRIKKVVSAEVFLWSKIGYAGTVDNISEMTDGRVLVIDYKNSRRPKREAWVQDYFIQGSAYFIAHWERSGQKPDGVEIWISNEEDSIPQIFSLTADDIKYYFVEFQRRLKLFTINYS